MTVRDRDWRNGSAATRAPRRSADPVQTVQRVLGNRGMGQVLARQRGTFVNSVRVGPLGPIEVKDSSVGDWIAHKSDAATKTEHWKAVDLDGAHIKRTSIGVPRP